mmetsp:Transcript_28990/g.88915  ORF Transcript_28990/g.88915 Transcript_28990/m.88915 type:complete len:105 (+) Transcript_28990:215-529(+)
MHSQGERAARCGQSVAVHAPPSCSRCYVVHISARTLSGVLQDADDPRPSSSYHCVKRFYAWLIAECAACEEAPMWKTHIHPSTEMPCAASLVELPQAQIEDRGI